VDIPATPTQATSCRFPCERCGADLLFEIGAWELACPYCGFAKVIALEDDAEIGEQDPLSTLERRAGERTTQEEGASEIRCASCHAAVVFSDRLEVHRCITCGSPLQAADAQRAEHRIAPDAVLPFAIEPDVARSAARGWLRSLWFAPRGFSRSEIPDRVTSVYLSYWSFDAATFTRYAGERGSLTRRENELRWQPIAGTFQRLFTDVAVAADSALPRAIQRGLEPWPHSGLRPYAPELVADHLTKTADVPLAEGWKLGRDRIEDELRHQVKRRIGGDRQRIRSLWTRFDALSYQHVLLPVWLLTLRHRGRPYRVVVNGATGEVQGERAWSANKIAAAVAGALVAAAAIGLALIAGP
jgi:DNA-directed RNA polymerase subunit RPC12/RpoP